MEMTHTDKSGKLKMVDVSGKEKNLRTAKAQAVILMKSETLKAIIENNIKKGDVLTAAKIAGIQAAKRTYELIPLCHNIFIDHIDIQFIPDINNNSIKIFSLAKTYDKTGIEMEALTSVSLSALTVYDMCKAIDKTMTITNIKLLSKTGGKSGNYISE
ncbi:cyclic pyranopterin monophosphate synthase MoaC [Bacteroidetes/Chlorobi group bacterium ChocPot_Mid]|nr:MAG: cyclic pyranopterin monophosphate synthase MoaC [Bacteroidetes/Chlorobi group bacterium ChocPot_Mid]